jgi:hypothetical protein
LFPIQFFISDSRSGHFTILSCRPRYYFFLMEVDHNICHTEILHYT